MPPRPPFRAWIGYYYYMQQDKQRGRMRMGRTYPHLSQSRAKPPDRSGQPFLQSPPAGGGAAQAGFMHLLAPAAAIAMGPPGPSLSPVHRSGLAHHSHPGTQRERGGGGEGRGQQQQQQQREVRCEREEEEEAGRLGDA
jgi:hypothetical protein